MNSFAFLKRTPDHAERMGCGQYNGYIAFDIKYEDLLVKDEKDSYGYDLYENYLVPNEAQGEMVEVTYCNRRATLERLGEICPLTAIPKEAAEGEFFLVFGYDTCHSWNTWAENDYKHEKAVTLDWLRATREMVLDNGAGGASPDLRMEKIENGVESLLRSMRRIDRILDVREMIARSERDRSEEEEEDE